MTPKDHETNRILHQKVPTPDEFIAKQDTEEKNKREKLVDTWSKLFKTELEEKSKKKVFAPMVKLHVVNCLTEHELTVLIDHFSKYGWNMYYAPESDTSWQMSAKSYHTFNVVLTVTKHYYVFEPLEK